MEYGEKGMNLFPAIDLYEGKAVRLVKGDYGQMTVYSECPEELGVEFRCAGAQYLHTVDLEGAKDGTTPNIETVEKLVATSGLKVQVGGGIRSPEIVRRYLDAGVHRVIIGTAAVTDPAFLQDMVDKYREKIAVGVDVRDGMAAIRGWQEKSALTCDALFQRLTEAGVQTVICTDISKDGMLAGPNLKMYKSLAEKYSVRLIASGGVTTLEDVKKLRDMDLYGAILGKAIYTGTIDLSAAVLACRGIL